MWIEVNSPHSGRPVRVRDKDVGRTIRDEEGRIFYALPRSQGQGYYGSRTRAGGPKEEALYDQMQAKEAHTRDVGAQRSEQQIHDARGKRRNSPRGKLVILLMAVIVAVLVYLFTIGPFGNKSWPWVKPPTPPAEPAQPSNAPPGNATPGNTPPGNTTPPSPAPKN